MSELGEEAIRFSSEPALGGPATVVEIRPDERDAGLYYRVTVSYLAGHPELGWRKRGAFRFWIGKEDFAWLLGEAEGAERELGSGESGAIQSSDGEDYLVVCTDGPGYLTELRSKGHSRWISGLCGRNANNAIAPMMARLVRYGTGLMLKHLDGEPIPSLRGAPAAP